MLNAHGPLGSFRAFRVVRSLLSEPILALCAQRFALRVLGVLRSLLSLLFMVFAFRVLTFFAFLGLRFSRS